MFTSLLIANRGEIACRIIDTARQMGIRTIAVYSEADAGARHVRLADEAVCIGPAAASQSYLDGGKILDAARQSKAEAIHPGYGFLSENPDFAEGCVKAGIVFVGPTAKSMRQMALKDQAKLLMQNANVPVTPGYHGEAQDEKTLLTEAAKIGYPVLIKAVAGGGGRGMRKVEQPENFVAELQSARREALGAFGDDKVLVEKFITNPRHIEVQVFGDSHGNVVHFFERDCSVQRRHQKVIEEAPAPGMSDEMRAAMCDAAIRAASAVSYENAGTVEFIVDGSAPLDPSKFWFMEMNTRLQVEHPVSEAVTGFDLVKLQLEIAAGGKLPSQDSIKLSGHAMEARLYAEQPAKGFLPSTGVLQHFSVKTGADLRLDTGFVAGDMVSEHYDPMLAKIIAVGADRAQAVRRLCAALKSVQIWPIQTNAGFLVQILRQPAFADGLHDTGFIAANLDDLIEPDASPASRAAHLALAMYRHGAVKTSHGPWARADGWRVNQNSQIFRRLQIDGQNCDTRLQIIGGKIEIDVDGTQYSFDQEDHSLVLDLVQVENQFVGFFNGLSQACLVPDAEADSAAMDALDTISAPMPGKILEVRTELGREVVQGEVLVVMEAMKMEHALAAPRDGVIGELSCAAGDQVKENTILVALTRTE